MFPKLIKNATLPDMEKENPKLLASIREMTLTEFNTNIIATHVPKESLKTLESKIVELETQLSTVSSNYTVLKAGVQNNQALLALTLIEEGKSEFDSLSAISDAVKNLSNFTSSAAQTAGNGSSIDAQTIDSKEKAIEAIIRSNPGISRAKAIQMARRQYTSLFINDNLKISQERR